MKKLMTKVNVVKLFKTHVKPFLKHTDKAAVSEAWVNYTDYLHKDGLITEKQVQNWTNPYN